LDIAFCNYSSIVPFPNNFLTVKTTQKCIKLLLFSINKYTFRDKSTSPHFSLGVHVKGVLSTLTLSFISVHRQERPFFHANSLQTSDKLSLLCNLHKGSDTRATAKTEKRVAQVRLKYKDLCTIYSPRWPNYPRWVFEERQQRTQWKGSYFHLRMHGQRNCWQRAIHISHSAGKNAFRKSLKCQETRGGRLSPTSLTCFLPKWKSPLLVDTLPRFVCDASDAGTKSCIIGPICTHTTLFTLPWKWRYII